MESHAAISRTRISLLPFAGVTFVPLFHAAWLFALGIFLTHFVWLRPGILLVALSATAILVAVSAQRAVRLAWLVMALFWLLLGAWCSAMEPQPAPAQRLLGLSDGLLRTIEGTVVHAGPVGAASSDDSEPADQTTQRLDVEITAAEIVDDRQDRVVPLEGGVRLTVRWTPSDSVNAIRCGERIRIVTRLLPPAVYHDPGAWDREAALLEQGITSTASVDGKQLEAAGAAPTRWWSPGGALPCWANEAQRRASALLLALPATAKHLPRALSIGPEDAAMLDAMVTGDRTYLSHTLRSAFERTGSFHMLVVSGLHLGIVAGCFFWLLRLIRVSGSPAAILTLAASAAYAFFTGFATPVQRSLWMVGLYMLGRVFYRERSPLNTIGFAALTLLALSPRSLFEAGFQMTLLAVIAIGGVASPLLESSLSPYARAAQDLPLVAIDPSLPTHIAQFRVTMRMFAKALASATSHAVGWRVLPWTVRSFLRMGELVVVAVVVELALTLPMAVYFHRVTVAALPVNLLIVPLLLVLVPTSLILLLALSIWPPVAAIPAVVVAALLHGGVWVVRAFASNPFADYRIPAPLLWQSCLFCVLLGSAIIAARGGRALRIASWAALVSAAVLVVIPRPIATEPGAMLFEAIDVGQGDSLLLITPEGKTLLVDGGGTGGVTHHGKAQFDIGEEVVSPALWSRGIRRLDVVALTHAHADHMDGLPAVLRNFRPRELWVGSNPRIKAYTDLIAEANQLGVQVRSLRAGNHLSFGTADVSVMAPFATYLPGPEPKNNDSLVLHLIYGQSSVQLEGDAEAPIEEAMLSEPNLKSVMLKVGHHGSTTSTTSAFLERVSPQWALISCGLRNTYGHPRPETLARLQAAGIRTLSTDLGGATCFRLKGTSAEPVPCR